MPHLRFRGVSEQAIQNMSQALVDDLSQLLGSGRDHFTLECVSSSFIFDGDKVSPEPMVEVLWFPRPQTVQDQFAHLVTQALRDQGETQDIAVFFQVLSAEAYYDNGEHY
ncbi:MULTISPECIES: DUF1904 domain-containing protein [Corallincola]|uniref:DUF1904 domain-containing protein n=3 Tax=Corallincola TaxID=1775176 RepID=A0A368NL05_9GAMM|nr:MULTISPECIES: DUF1904 domain-containing protein [Corallincola]RCU50455.1 DUF1904 domain-containing protein [Corallincola holothuriorum]TAA48534.1 DUF1904 domain-containing protein [Corallincola spongiicola]TCI01783.1 DUF1904 domain-containing protein [Corallincola luteus]